MGKVKKILSNTVSILDKYLIFIQNKCCVPSNGTYNKHKKSPALLLSPLYKIGTKPKFRILLSLEYVGMESHRGCSAYL